MTEQQCIFSVNHAEQENKVQEHSQKKGASMVLQNDRGFDLEPFAI